MQTFSGFVLLLCSADFIIVGDQFLVKTIPTLMLGIKHKRDSSENE